MSPDRAAPSAPIYLDYNGSTPVLPRVREVAARALEEGFGNPSASHAHGRRARAFVERGREQVAALLHARPEEIVFTSGGTESSNLALRGHAEAVGTRGLLLVTTALEHPATSRPVARLAAAGARVVTLAPGPAGVVEPARLAEALAGSTGPACCSVILAQNETGALHDVAAMAAHARERGALFHTDAAQAVGKVPVDVGALGVDLLSLAGHKLHAPKGIGALFVRSGTRLEPFLTGAGHERGLRPGTENVAGIAALGEACALAAEDLATEQARQLALRERLASLLCAAGFVVHAAGAARLPNTLNGRFPGVSGPALLSAVPGLSFTTGSACHAGTDHPSPVLTAMGLPHDEALGAIRLSFGRLTTLQELTRAAELLLAAVALRRQGPAA